MCRSWGSSQWDCLISRRHPLCKCASRFSLVAGSSLGTVQSLYAFQGGRHSLAQRIWCQSSLVELSVVEEGSIFCFPDSKQKKKGSLEMYCLPVYIS
jgi:hypothetical protein